MLSSFELSRIFCTSQFSVRNLISHHHLAAKRANLHYGHEIVKALETHLKAVDTKDY